MVRGGTGVNIVPGSCELHIDRRLIPGETPLGAFEDCRRELLSNLGKDFPLEWEEPWISAPPLNTSAGAEVSQVAMAAVSGVVGHTQPIGVPFFTNASTLSAGGIPSIVLGPGDIAQAHTEDEWIDVSEIRQAAEIYFRIMTSGGDTG
jgi:acetylornithine deacetylase/succinyl-diaminopimelate desuccinylase-like protein